MNIKDIYDKMVNKRNDFLDYADESARLTLPTVAPKGQRIRERPDAIIGPQSVRSLASSLQKSMFGAKPFVLDLPAEVWTKIDALPDGPKIHKTIRDRLDKREDDVMDSLKAKTAGSRFASAIRRNLIEGTTAAINLNDRVQFFPLRSLVVEREAGVVRILMIEESIDPDPLDDGDEESAQDPEKQEEFKRYTLVNFEKGEVYTQDGEDGPAKKVSDPPMPNSKGEVDWSEYRSPTQFIVPVNEISDIDDYAPGYVYNYLRGFNFVNHGEASLSEAMAAAAWNRPRVRPGSPVSENLRAFFEGRSGEPWLGEEKDVEWLSSAGKLGDWGFVVQLLQRKEMALAMAFAMGIKDRLVSGDTTATEVLEIVDELNKQTHDLLGTLQETMVEGYIRSEVDLQERFGEPLFPELPPEIMQHVRVVVTTGANALEKQRWIERFVSVTLPSIAQLDPTLRIRGKEIADAAVRTSRYEEAEKFYYTVTREELIAEQAAIQASNQATSAGTRQETIMTRGGPQPKQPAQPMAA